MFFFEFIIYRHYSLPLLPSPLFILPTSFFHYPLIVLDLYFLLLHSSFWKQNYNHLWIPILWWSGRSERANSSFSNTIEHPSHNTPTIHTNWTTYLLIYWPPFSSTLPNTISSRLFSNSLHTIYTNLSSA